MANFCMYCGKPTSAACVHANPPPPLPQNVVAFPAKNHVATAAQLPPVVNTPQFKQHVTIEQALAVQDQFNEKVITALTNTLNTIKGMGDAINKLENALDLLQKRLDNKN